MLSTCLDIFEARIPSKTVGQDFGLLQAIDERLAMYGWLTNTGVKFVVVVDMEGRATSQQDSKHAAVLGLKNSDLTPVSCCVRESRCRCVVILIHPGFPSFADGVHSAAAKPVLFAR